MKTRFLTIAACTMLALGSCSTVSSNNVEPSEKRVKKDYTGQLAAFDKIETATAINVVYTQNDEPQRVVLDVPENMAKYVSLKVEDGELEVSFKNLHTVKGNHHTTVYVSGPAIRNFETSSAGNIYLKNGLSYNGEVKIEASSAGNVHVEAPVRAKKLDLESSSAGNIKVNGVEVDRLEVESSSAGNIKVTGIKAVSVDAEASSAGNVTLEGTCRTFSKEKSSAGNIHAKNLKRQQ